MALIGYLAHSLGCCHFKMIFNSPEASKAGQSVSVSGMVALHIASLQSRNWYCNLDTIIREGQMIGMSRMNDMVSWKAGRRKTVGCLCFACLILVTCAL